MKMITSTLSGLMKEQSRQFDEAFRNVLKKRNISEQDWIRYGKLVQGPKQCKCVYKDEVIFYYATKPVIIQESDCGITVSFPYGEPDQV